MGEWGQNQNIVFLGTEFKKKVFTMVKMFIQTLIEVFIV